MTNAPKDGHAISAQLRPLTLRQRISARVASTGRRLLGLATDRTAIEDRIAGLERQIGELLLHGRRTAIVESQLGASLQSIVSLETRLQDVQQLTDTLPGLAQSTQRVLNDLSHTETVVSAKIDNCAADLSKSMDRTQASLGKKLDAAQKAIDQSVQNLGKDLSESTNTLIERHADIKSDVNSFQIVMSGTLANLDSQQTAGLGAIHGLKQSIADAAEKIDAQNSATQTSLAGLSQELSGSVGQLSELGASSQTQLQELKEELSGSVNRLFEQGLASQSGLQEIRADIVGVADQQREQFEASEKGLQVLNDTRDAIAQQTVDLTNTLAQLGATLAAATTSQSVMSHEQKELLDHLFGQTFARLEDQTSSLRHAHKILLQQPIYIADGMSAVVRVGSWDGHPIAVPSQHAGVVHGHYIHGAASGEPGVRAAIRALVKEGMCAIDVGAHVGVHSVIMGFHVGDTGRLICIEPDPDLAAGLRQTMLMNGYTHKSEVINAALADSPARMSFFRTLHSPESTLFPPEELTNRDTIEVDVTSLDHALPKGTKVDFLKIDAEGAEARIYRGMLRVLAENQSLAMIVEFAPEHFKRAGEDPKAYLQNAIKDGFSLAIVAEPDGSITPTTVAQVLKLTTCNLLLKRG